MVAIRYQWLAGSLASVHSTILAEPHNIYLFICFTSARVGGARVVDVIVLHSENK